MSPAVRRLAGKHQAVLAALSAFALFLSITLWMWQSSTAETTQIARERFEFKLDEARFAIAQRLLAYEQVLRGGVGLFAASRDVTRAEWAAYVRTLDIERNFPGIQSLDFSARVLPARLAAHRQQIRAEGFPDYAVRPAGERAEYAPIVYVEPFDWRNLRAFGYDMRADPALRVGLERARDTGLPSVSGKVTLAQEMADGVQSGFVMCLPVFRNGAPRARVEERRAALDGHVCSTFRTRDLMQGILGPETLPNIRLRIFDGAAPTPESLMYDTIEGARGTPAAASFSDDQAFEFDGHTWTLHFDSLPAFDAGIDLQKPRFILFGGLLVSALFATVAWSLSLNRRRARALAELNAGLEAEIDERTKLESELKRARDAAEAANQAKSDFLANVSHELRTPLTLILAPLEQLLGAETPPAAGERTQLERAQRNALLLMNRVNDILDFSKAEAGKFDVRPEPVDLAEAIGGLAEDAATAAESKGCALSWRIDPALGTVYLDPGHFEKIVLNLLSNAIKFTPAGGAIRLTAAPLAGAVGEGGEGGEFFEFAVQDSGIGIAPDRLPLLFRRFSQIDNSATRRYSGTGIGLALVKELAELMGGEAGVDSELGRGSRFFVRLPRGSAACAGPAGAGETPAGPAPSQDEAGQRRLRFEDGSRDAPRAAGAADEARPPSAASATVLVVDDSPDMLSYLGELLASEYTVATAADGEAAWALLQRRAIDVIVSDVMMPELDGFGLTARIKASAGLSHLPVILLTARGGSDASASGLETGADDYIAKPFSPAELKARVRAALRMGQVQAELRQKSHRAGMAEVAANVLHNVGNVLNSVNVSAGLASSRVRASKLPGLARALQLINAHGADLGDFLSRDEKGKLLPDYLNKLAETLAAEQRGLAEELGALTKSVDHIKDIIASQQSYAGSARFVELASVRELVDEALRMRAGELERLAVTVRREFAELPRLPLDRHRVLQILVNLIGNAGQAMAGTGRPARLTLGVDADGTQLRIRVADDGEGIAAENLARIFNHGFTTRPNGHGFGLHSCALAAKEMGGRLRAESDGPGRGAVFTLELPINRVHEAGEPASEPKLKNRT